MQSGRIGPTSSGENEAKLEFSHDPISVEDDFLSLRMTFGKLKCIISNVQKNHSNFNLIGAKHECDL